MNNRKGIYVENNTLMRNGKEFRTLGVNYLGLFYDAINFNYETDILLKGMETLAEYGVKLMRVPVNSTYTLKKLSKYFNEKEKWFDVLDKIVKKAEDLDMGMLCSFFWSERTIPSFYNEEIGESMRDANSLSSKYMETYLREFIERYGESSAIWGWEFGNEIMLEAQLPTMYWKDNKKLFTVGDVKSLYLRFEKTIKELDRHNRFIGSGDAGIRPCSYNAVYNDIWKNDTPEQQLRMMKELYPMEGLSWHEYANNADSILNPQDLPKTALRFFDDGNGGEKNIYKTWEEYFAYLIETAKIIGKVPYLGETSFTPGGADRRISYEENKRVFNHLAECAYKTNFPLVLFWNYDPYTNEVENVFDGVGSGWEYSWNERWEAGKAVLETIKEYNSKRER